MFSETVWLLVHLNKGLIEIWLIDLVTSKGKYNWKPEAKSEYLPSSITAD